MSLHCISPSDMAYLLQIKDPFQRAAHPGTLLALVLANPEGLIPSG